MKQLIIDSLNHPASPYVGATGYTLAAPTDNTFDLVLKIGTFVIAILPALKQLFSKKKKVG